MRRYVAVALLLACMMGMATAVIPTRPRPKTGAPSCVSPIVSMTCNLDPRTGYVMGISYRTLAEVTAVVNFTGSVVPFVPGTLNRYDIRALTRDGTTANYKIPDPSLGQRLVCAPGTFDPSDSTKNLNVPNIQSRLSWGLEVFGVPPTRLQMADNGGAPAVDINIDGGTLLPSYLISRVRVFYGPGGATRRGKVALILFDLTNYLSDDNPLPVVGQLQCGQPQDIDLDSLNFDNPDDNFDPSEAGINDGVQRYLSGFSASCYKRNLVNNINDPVYYITKLTKPCWVPKPAMREVSDTEFRPVGVPYNQADTLPENLQPVCGNPPTYPFRFAKPFATTADNKKYCP